VARTRRYPRRVSGGQPPGADGANEDQLMVRIRVRPAAARRERARESVIALPRIAGYRAGSQTDALFDGPES